MGARGGVLALLGGARVRARLRLAGRRLLPSASPAVVDRSLHAVVFVGLLDLVAAAQRLAQRHGVVSVLRTVAVACVV